MGLDKLGSQAKNLSVMNGRLVQSLQHREHIAQVVMSLGIKRLAHQKTTQALGCLFEASLSLKHIREVQEGRPQPRLQVDGLPILRDRLVELAQL